MATSSAGTQRAEPIIQLAVDDAALEGLLSFGADAAESEDGGDDEPYSVPPVSPCWLEVA